MEKKVIRILQNSSLCRNMSERDIEKLLKDYHSEIRKIKKGSFIFTEDDIPRKIFLLISGSIVIGKDTSGGKRVIITQIEREGEIFGEVYAFREHRAYDMYAEATEDVVLLTLDNEIFLEQGTEQFVRTLWYNLMTIFADKAYHMNVKLRILGGSNIREKIVRFLAARQSENGIIGGNLTREAMADSLNVTRPSLSRELGRMQEEGIIRLDKREIVITNQETFDSYL